MKLYVFSTSVVSLLLVLFLGSVSAEGAETSTIIHESATLGTTGQTSGLSLDSTRFIGSRFYTDRTVEVTAIGGHIAEWTSGNFFGAIISLTSMIDLPDGSPFGPLEVLASVVFDPGTPSSDFRIPLSVSLEPGYYALVFGTDALGSSGGTGAMPYRGQTDVDGPSYFEWDGSYWWQTVPSPPPRFVVEGLVGYCGAGSDACEEYISGVVVGSIDNTGTGCDQYADYTHLSTTMEIGGSYPITVTNGNPYSDGEDHDQCGIWVDWNQDKDFDDANETIAVSGSPGDGPYTGTLTPPAGAVLSDTRMRIRIKYIGVVSPCGNSDYGEVEDYTIVIIGGVEPPAGDMDGDGDVDLIDVGELCEKWLTDDVTCDIYPEGGDGVVDMQDFAVQAEDYGP